jgi:hypothetical protein
MMNTFTQLPKTLASLKANNGLGVRTAIRAGGIGRGMNHNQSR